MKPAAISALLVLGASACGRGDPDLARRHDEAEAGLGRCTQEEPGLPAKDGQAVFYVDRTPTVGGEPVGRHAALLTCLTAGPSGTALTLILPNLSDTVPPPGRYRVQAPGVIPDSDSLPHLAWADAQVPASAGVSYRGMGGELVVEATDEGGVVGSYLIAFERAADAPQRGPVRMVVGGAFAAPRNRLPRETALPRGPR